MKSASTVRSVAGRQMVMIAATHVRAVVPTDIVAGAKSATGAGILTSAPD